MKKALITMISMIIVASLNAQDGNSDNHTVTITIPGTSIMDIESTNGSNITFTPDAITDAGLGFDFNLTNEDLWINYSNISATSGSSRKIEVAMTSATGMPDGMLLKVQAQGHVGAEGKGAFGLQTGEITLSNPPPVSTDILIQNIGSAFTGNGPNKGHKLTYTLSYDNTDFQDLYAGLSISLTITYTITDE